MYVYSVQVMTSDQELFDVFQLFNEFYVWGKIREFNEFYNEYERTEQLSNYFLELQRKIIQ